MKDKFKQRVNKLREIVNRFDPESNRQKLLLINEINVNKIQFTNVLNTYHESLLFIMAFPLDTQFKTLAEKEILKISALLKKQPEKTKEQFLNSGIPFSEYFASFSHDCTRWLLTHPHCSVEIYNFENTLFDLNEVLKVTVPSVERSETTAGLSNDDLLQELVPDKKLQLQYIINELSRLDEIPYIKDHYYDGLGVQTISTPNNKLLSKAFNTIKIPEVFYHDELIKHFDVAELLDRRIPEESVLSDSEKKNLIRVIKNSMMITERETDPATYMNEETLRLFHLERGVSVALYGMTAERQLPMESYIGYTMFKNGFPAAYAGGWIFGNRSDYGLNIYDQFRGGESAYMVAQILRVYRQLFNINYFIVEATQFGLDSPEGIETGVFWFYYKLGFRPVDSKLRQLAANEYRKISANKNYRSSKVTLIKFTKSNIFLNLGKGVQPGVYDITEKVKKMIIKRFKSNSIIAEESCVKIFLEKINSKESFSKDEYEVLKQVSLWAAAMKIDDKSKLDLMFQMVKLKPVDEYRYQEKLRLFFT
jgi:hypothetical protein